MNKAAKINILNALIERTEKLECPDNFARDAIVNEALSFIHHALKEARAPVWEKKINIIQWPSNIPGRPMDTGTLLGDFWLYARDELCVILKSIKNEIEQYTEEEHNMEDKQLMKNDIVNNGNRSSKKDDNPIIFLSHSSSDKKYGDALKNFITGLGVKNDQFIYTSHPLHKIPLDENIYEYLRKQFGRKIFVIFLWSDAYLNNPICLCEMGAAWVTQSDFTNIFIPSFQFDNNPRFNQCPVDKQKMGVVLTEGCRTSMIELKNKILSLFRLEIDEISASHLLDEFVGKITNREIVEKHPPEAKRVRAKKAKPPTTTQSVDLPMRIFKSKQ